MNTVHLTDGPGTSLRAIPPLPALLAFERAASQLSFRRAARDLSLSPSAISHQIRGLEQQFGTKLFVRGARSVRLTADGERHFAKSQPRWRLYRTPAATCCDIAAMRTPNSGSVRCRSSRVPC
jgi:DNA-binding transcriptional LysR family regulator